MRILLYEIKKLFTWKTLVLLIFVNGIVYFLLIEYDINYFPSSDGQHGVSYKIGVEMVNKYGANFSEEEFSDFKQTYETRVEEANYYLQSNQESTHAGILTYGDFGNMDWDNEVHSDLSDQIMFDDNVAVFWELQERTSLIDFYESKEESLDLQKSKANAKQKVRYQELADAGHYQVYTGYVLDNFKNFISNVTIAIILSVALVISPIYINDRSRSLLDLQYTSKKGRNLYKTKAIAGLISALFVITGLLTFYLSLYLLNNISMFFDVPIYLFIGSYYWYDPTFFQYMILSIAGIYILSIVYTLLVMSFSTIASNYIVLIGIQIPVVIGILAFGLNYVVTNIISLWLPQWFVPTSYSTLLAVSVIFMILLWRREKKRDIVL
ncbi:hypothetical protein ACS127_00070 [Amphibacillus sp. Q70]|uniref:hypothetical protein n=1 Tax=Amphibacillus sp. Q70 TaxID=3453416 RepID=UPI003F870E58